MTTYQIAVIIEKDEDGYYAFCPDLDGCYTQGETYEGALENIRDAIMLHIADRRAAGEEVRLPDMVSLTSLEIAV